MHGSLRILKLTRVGSSLALLSSAFAGTACRPAPCEPTGANRVTGTASATVSDDSTHCTADVAGAFDDASGQTVVQLACAATTVADPRQAPSLRYTAALVDPRAIDASSPVSLSMQMDPPIPIPPVTLTILAATGTSVALPTAVSDDFLRHFVVHLALSDTTSIGVNVTIRAADLRTPASSCPTDCLGLDCI